MRAGDAIHRGVLSVLRLLHPMALPAVLVVPETMDVMPAGHHGTGPRPATSIAQCHTATVPLPGPCW